MIKFGKVVVSCDVIAAGIMRMRCNGGKIVKVMMCMASKAPSLGCLLSVSVCLKIKKTGGRTNATYLYLRSQERHQL